ncbi:unnamed protein product, partial [Hymenolepis diminuta]
LLRLLPISSLPPARSPLYLSLCNSFQTRCGFPEYVFSLSKSWCSALQLLLAFTQTATNWWLLLLLLS